MVMAVVGVVAGFCPHAEEGRDLVLHHLGAPLAEVARRTVSDVDAEEGKDAEDVPVQQPAVEQREQQRGADLCEFVCCG
jgi:hypothetical protein